MGYFQITKDSFFSPPSPKDPEAGDLSIIVGEEELAVAHFRYFIHSSHSRQAETRETTLLKLISELKTILPIPSTRQR